MENDLIHRNTALAILRALREAVGNYAPVDDIDDAIDMIQNVNAVDAMYQAPLHLLPGLLRLLDCRGISLQPLIPMHG